MSAAVAANDLFDYRKTEECDRISTVFLEGKPEKNCVSSGNVSGSDSDPWLYEPGTVQLE